jgi:large subunit ribosomal protein L24
MKIKKGMQVKIINGKDKGKTGKVVLVLPKKNKIIVEGVNFVTKFEKKREEKKKGGMIRVEAPFDASKAIPLKVQEKTASSKTEKAAKVEKKVKVKTEKKETIKK